MIKGSAEMEGGFFTLENDPRFLPFGLFLRKTKINELPQLINVFMGDMSLVGFRPLLEPGYIQARNLTSEDTYSMKPGITSLSSIVLRNEEDIISKVSNKKDYYSNQILPLKVEIDEWWFQNRSIYNYFVILILTILALALPQRLLPFNMLRNPPSKLVQ